MKGLGLGLGFNLTVGAPPVFDINDTIFSTDVNWIANSMSKTGDNPCAVRQVAALSQHSIYKQFNQVADRSYQIDVRLKRPITGSQRFSVLFIYGTPIASFVVDHDAKSLYSQENIQSAAVTDIGGGILSLTGTYTPTITADAPLVIQSISDALNVTFTGDVNEGFDLHSVVVSH